MAKPITIQDVKVFLIQAAERGNPLHHRQGHHLRARPVRPGLRHLHPALPGGGGCSRKPFDPVCHRKRRGPDRRILPDGHGPGLVAQRAGLEQRPLRN